MRVETVEKTDEERQENETVARAPGRGTGGKEGVAGFRAASQPVGGAHSRGARGGA